MSDCLAILAYGYYKIDITEMVEKGHLDIG